MSDPRPTAREVAHAILLSMGFRCTVELATATGRVIGHTTRCDRAVAIIERDRAASDAREDRLREALERIRDGRFKEFSRFSITALDMCEIAQTCAAEAMAAVPPGGDR